MFIKGQKIDLRSVDISDIDTILLWENSVDEEMYGVYNEVYTRQDVERFVFNQMAYPIEQTEQQRFMIIEKSGERVGAIDIVDYNKTKADISIIIRDKSKRGRGYGGEALRLVIEYALSIGITNLRATIDPDNAHSINLFTSVGFEVASPTEYIYQHCSNL